MKFSVLLPTCNRLEYLRYAVESVCRQDHPNWEIVISDNFSEDDIAGYVASLNEPRICYLRTDSLLPVTDNWNNALDHSTGEYIVMLGDDDGLMPGYFTAILDEMKRFADPDFVYVSAYFFAYPGVMPDAPKGFLREDKNKIFTETQTFWLDRRRAKDIARGYLDFRMPVASNMQFSLISRRKLEELRRDGKFFHSPYPDFYATPALFLGSERILVVPRPLVIIGITPKSYGYFHFNNLAHEGVKFLGNEGQLSERAHRVRLPGTSYNDSWLFANEALAAKHAARHGMTPAYRHYRFLQIVHSYKKCYFGRAMPTSDLAPLRARLTPYERYVLGSALQVGFSALRHFPSGLRERLIGRLRALIGQHAISDQAPTVPSFRNLVEVFEFFAPGNAKP
jgi:glycosyltransferase involved in cell wall biosynthesis